MSTLSLFLPSRPPPTPACYLHPPLPRAALTHRRTPPLICRLRPRPTPTPVSVSEADMGLFNRGGDVCFTSVCYLRLLAELTVLPSLPFRAHIAWRFSAGPGSRNRAAGHES